MFSTHPKSAYWSQKNDISPDQVTMYSNKKFWFDCDKCNHDFIKQVSGITSSKPSWCPYCSHQKICADDTCNDCFEKSFASCDMVRHWIEQKNIVRPRDVFKGSGKKFWFKCDACGHDVLNRLDIVKKRGWCYYCKGIQLCDEENCDFCFQRSIASHPKAIYFKYGGKGKTARQIAKGSKTECTFECNKCKHLITLVAYSVSSGSWCGYCTSHRWCRDRDCVSCFNLSFASVENSRYVMDKSIDLTRIRKSSKDKLDFKCNKCDNIFLMSILSVSKGCWCHKCINKTETKLFDYLFGLYDNVTHQPRFDWCKSDNGNFYPFDFRLPDKHIIIELDGEQHFKQVRDWKSPEIQRARDVYKMGLANKNGQSIIRLLQIDVLPDRNNWKNNLNNAIKKIDSQENIMNVYIGRNNIYSKHIKDMNMSTICEDVPNIVLC